MIVLVDTSVWADHFRAADSKLRAMLAAGQARMHPFVIGELAMGNLRDRHRTVTALTNMASVPIVEERAWLSFVEQADLGGSGLGFVDAHLLAAATLGDILLWTRDRRLSDRAERLGRRWLE